MRIRLETNGKPPFWLVGNPALNPRTEQSCTIGETSFQIVRSVQEVAGAEWEVRQFFDRYNQAVYYQATVRWEFADEWALMDFVSSLAPINPDDSLHSWSGNVWLRSELMKDGGEVKEWLLPGAVVALAGVRQDGAVALHLTYRISAGGFGEPRGGLMLPVSLVGYGEPFLALSFTVEDMDDLMASFELGTTDYFQLSLSRVAAGGGVFAANYRFHPGAADGGGTSVNFNYPFSDALTRFMSRVNTQFSGYISVSVTGGVMTFIEAAAGALSEFSLELTHRHDSVTDDIATFEAEPIPGELFSLTGVHSGTTYSLTGIHS